MEINSYITLSSLNQFALSGHYQLSASNIWSGIYNLRDNKINCAVVQSPEISDVVVQFKTPYKYSAIEQHKIKPSRRVQAKAAEKAYTKRKNKVSAAGDPFTIRSAHGWVTFDIRKFIDDTLSSVWLDNTHTLAMTDIAQLSDVDVQNIQKIYIPPHITSLPDGFLSDAVNLKNIYFDTDPDKSQLSSIGASAFCNCQQLEILHFPNSVLSIGEFAFHDVRNIKSVLFGTEYIMSYDPSTSFSTVNPYNTYIDKQDDLQLLCTLVEFDENTRNMFSAARQSSHKHSYKRSKCHYADLSAHATGLSIETIEQREMTWEYSAADILREILEDIYSKCSEIWQSIANGVEAIFMNQDNVTTRSEEEARSQAQAAADAIAKDIKDDIQHHNEPFNSISVKVISDYISGRCTNTQMIGHGIKLLAGALPEGDQDSWTSSIEECIRTALQDFANNLINSSEITVDDIRNDVLSVVRGKLTESGEINLLNYTAQIANLTQSILSMINPNILTALELIRSTRIMGYHVNSNVVGTLAYKLDPTCHDSYKCVGK